MADLILGRIDGDVPVLIPTAERILQSAAADRGGTSAASPDEAQTLSNLGLGYLALVEWERGHLHAAREIARRALETLQQRAWTEQAQAITVYLVLARVDLEQDHPDTAQMFLVPPWPRTATTRTGRRIRPCRPPRRDYGWRPGGWTGPPTCWSPCTRSLRGAGTRRCSSGGSRLPKLTTPPSGARRQRRCRRGQLCLARAEDALGTASAAAEILASLRAQSSSPVITAQAWLVTALAADHHRDDHRAQSALDRALAIAEPEGIRRPFAALGGRRIETMLRHRLGLTGAALAPAAPGFVEALLSGFGSGHHLAVELRPLVAR